MSKNLEEGEIEDGEIPEEGVYEEESGEKSDRRSLTTKFSDNPVKQAERQPSFAAYNSIGTDAHDDEASEKDARDRRHQDRDKERERDRAYTRERDNYREYFDRERGRESERTKSSKLGAPEETDHEEGCINNENVEVGNVDVSKLRDEIAERNRRRGLGEPPAKLEADKIREKESSKVRDKDMRRQDSETGRMEKEKELLIDSIRVITKNFTVPEVLKSLDAACKNLKSVTRKLYSYYKLAKKSNSKVTGADSCSELAGLGELLFSGMRALHVVTSTGAGKSQDLSAAKDVIKAVIRDRYIFFTSQQRKQLDSFIKSSPLFGAVYASYQEERLGKTNGKADDGRGDLKRVRSTASEAHDTSKAMEEVSNAVSESISKHSDGPVNSHTGSESGKEILSAAAPSDDPPAKRSKLSEADTPPAPPSVDHASSPRLPSAVGHHLSPASPNPLQHMSPLTPAESPSNTAGDNADACAHRAMQQPVLATPLSPLTPPDSPKAEAMDSKPPPPLSPMSSASPGGPDHDMQCSPMSPFSQLISKAGHPSEATSAPEYPPGMIIPAPHEPRAAQSNLTTAPPPLHPASQQLPASHTVATNRVPAEECAPQQRHPDLYNPPAPQAAVHYANEPPAQDSYQLHHAMSDSYLQARSAEHDAPEPQGTEPVPEEGATQADHKYMDYLLTAPMDSSDAQPPSYAPSGFSGPPPPATSHPVPSHQAGPKKTSPVKPRVMRAHYKPSSPREVFTASPYQVPAPAPAPQAFPEPSYVEEKPAWPAPVAPAAEKRVDPQSYLDKMVGDGKLCLVLDIDHTLLNSARFLEVDRETESKLHARMKAEATTYGNDNRELYHLSNMQMWTKLRPGVREFLHNANNYFQLWIHTNGNRVYADGMVELLDPTGAYFGNRIIAQGSLNGEEGLTDLKKTLMQGLQGCEPVVIIVDDTTSVWHQHQENLLPVERYVYFPSSRKQLNLNAKSLLEFNRDECPQRGMLMVVLEVLLKIHQKVFDAMRNPVMKLPSGDVVYRSWDVRDQLKQEKQKVLSGLKIAFSRVIPLEVKPQSHPLWQLAEQFGAVCSPQVDDSITHLVAAGGGTEKVYVAQRTGKLVVSPAWLECSCTLWRRADEARFALRA